MPAVGLAGLHWSAVGRFPSGAEHTDVYRKILITLAAAGLGASVAACSSTVPGQGAAATSTTGDDLESPEETRDVMDSTALLNDIPESLTELGEADVPALTKDPLIRPD